MTGEFTHSLDAKGRLFIPVRLRDDLGPEFYVTISQEQCLYAYNMENWRRFEEKAASMSYNKQAQINPLFYFAAKCEMDAQGRILLPQNLREMRGIQKNVVILGANNHAEFWDADTWMARRAALASPENIARVMQELDF